jgi:hypothetical protein
MHRLRCLVVIGALAVAVSVVGAGPAFAAKGGNSDNAHACQHGGHETLFEAETGDPFKNTGDCASHGAKGGTLGQFAGQAACAQPSRSNPQGVGGTFVILPRPDLWACNRYPLIAGVPVPPPILALACGEDNGFNLTTADNFDGTASSICDMRFSP